MNDDETNDQQAEGTTDEQSTTDQAGGDTGTGVEGDAAAAEVEDGNEEAEGEAGDTDDGAPEDEVISQKEFDRLKDNPEALRQALNKGATKKFQQLAATRKELEPWSDFAASYAKNPRAAALALAQGLGLEVKAPRTEQESEKAVKSMADQIREKVKNALGPEYEDIADKMSAAITDAASLMVDEAVRPLKEGQESLIAETAQREASQALVDLGKRHPDWRKHETKMFDLSRKLLPQEGMSEADYLDSLYTLATAEGKEGDAVKKAAKRMGASAKKAAGERTIPSSSVSKSPAGRTPTWAEAAAAARRGERLD